MSDERLILDLNGFQEKVGNIFILLQEIRVFYPDVTRVAVTNVSNHFYKLFEDVFHFFGIGVDNLLSSNSHQLMYSLDEENSFSGSFKRFFGLNKISTLTPREFISSGFSVGDRINISVHLKSNPLDTKSNASISDWGVFFAFVQDKYPEFTFNLLGDEDISLPREVKNVVRFKGRVSQYFALVCVSDGFMGMSSAFCNAAILGAKPYIIWKHPNHHTEHMKSEMLTSGGFTFSLPNQKFILEYDKVNSLCSQFENWVLGTFK